MSPERVKPGRLPCRWHWVGVSAGQWPPGQLLYELRKPLAPPLSSEVSFCSALRPVLLCAHPLPLSAPLPFWICLRQSAFPFTSLSISGWIFWSPLSSCVGAAHSPSSRALREASCLHQLSTSLSPPLVQERSPAETLCGVGKASPQLSHAAQGPAHSCRGRHSAVSSAAGVHRPTSGGSGGAILAHSLILKNRFPHGGAK